MVFKKFILLHNSKLKTCCNKVLNFKFEPFLVVNAVTWKILAAWKIGKNEEQEVEKKKKCKHMFQMILSIHLYSQRVSQLMWHIVETSFLDDLQDFFSMHNNKWNTIIN